MRVAKWGNSLAVRLPAPWSKRSGFRKAMRSSITVAGTHRFEIERDDSRTKALARLNALRRPLPKGFRFTRDEANER